MCKTVCTALNHQLLARLTNAGLPPELAERVCATPYHLGESSYPNLCTVCCDGREVHRVYGREDFEEFLASDIQIAGMVQTLIRLAGYREQEQAA